MATKRYNFKFHCTKDADIIARLDQQDNMQDYIRFLIKSDIFADSFNLKLATPEQEQNRESARQDYYEVNCKAFYDGVCNGTCEHFVSLEDGGCCTIEDDFNDYWEGVKDNAISTN